MANPVVVELTRGALTESFHRGAVAIVRASGEAVFELGDTSRPVFPRSAIKPLQCLPLIETGAADRFGFGPAEIALACASHAGTEQHVALAAAMLARAGLDVDALACGAHPPAEASADRELFRAGRRPTALHNNCSGKHAGMLATAVHCGEPPGGYWQPEHPVQVRIRRILEGLLGRELGGSVLAVDGCSAPNWAMSVRDLARAFAQFATGEGAAAPHRVAAERIMSACWQAPELVAGEGRLDTEMMRRLPEEVLMKTGAEGVYCAALPKLRLGIALKIDDGAKRAAEALVAHLIAQFIPKAVSHVPSGVMRSWRGLTVGEVRLCAALMRALENVAA
ncbi:MAG TPA: asparaginase [Hyphomicrobiaceae bacterium]|nr:asparaginase [Hyphomicrobiaceae bacterium]